MCFMNASFFYFKNLCMELSFWLLVNVEKNEGSKAKILKNIKRIISFRKENHLPYSHQA